MLVFLVTCQITAAGFAALYRVACWKIELPECYRAWYRQAFKHDATPAEISLVCFVRLNTASEVSPARVKLALLMGDRTENVF